MSEGDLDLVAAELRADATDMRGLVVALAARLEGALPRLVSVRRRKTGGFRSKETEVQAIAVDLGDTRYELVAAPGGYECTRHSVVRGITLKREPCALQEWVRELVATIAARAEISERDRSALEGLVR